MKLTNEAIDQLKQLGKLEDRGTHYILRVPYTEKDDDLSDTDERSYVARVENIAPESLCEHEDYYENEEHELRITLPEMDYFVCGNSGADDSVMSRWDTLAEAQEEANKQEDELQIFDSGRGTGRGGFDAFIVRSVNKDHALARAARGPFESRNS